MTRRTSSVYRGPAPPVPSPFPPPDSLDEDRGEQATLADDARRDAVRQALASALTGKQREVVEMHFFEGLSQGEIARKLGISQQVVQKRLHGTARRGRMIGGALPRLQRALAPLFGARAPGGGP